MSKRPELARSIFAQIAPQYSVVGAAMTLGMRFGVFLSLKTDPVGRAGRTSTQRAS